MPKYLGDILTVTEDELVPLCYNTYGALAKALKRYEGKDYGIKRAMLGGNGRELLVVFDSLPKKYQQLIGDPRKADHILENYYKVDSETVDFYTTFQFEDGEYLSDDAQDKHITNAAMLKACIALETDRRTERLNKGSSMRNLTKSVFNDYISFRAMKEEKNPETFKCTLPQHYNRWLPDAFKAFKKAPDSKAAYRSIIKRYKSNTNAQKVRKNKEGKLLNDLFATQEHKPYVSEIARQYEAFLNGYIDIVNQATGEFYNPKEYRAISERTIKNYLTKWENTIGTHSVRSGDRQVLTGNFRPHHSFERPHFAGSLYSIDDRQPPFKYETGERMWFYIGMDVASTALTAYVWGKSKKELIINFYRQVVRNYHEWGFCLPDSLEAEMSLNSSFINTFLRDGYMFQNVRIEANNARGKAIEREFGNLRYGQEKELEGWIPRPHARNEANQSKPGPEILIPYNELVLQSIGQLEEWNNSPHPDHPTVTRYEYFRDNQHPDLTPTNYRAFLRDLGYKTSTSVNVGIIRLQNREWLLGDNGKIATGENLISLMKKIEGYDIDVYWLDDNKGNVFVAHVYIGDHYICEAIAKPKPNRAPIERTPEQNEAMSKMARYIKTIEVYQKTRKNDMEAVEVIKIKPRTLNDAFVTPQFRPQLEKEKAPSPARDEALELTEVADGSLEYQPQEDTGGSWRAAFND